MTIAITLKAALIWLAIAVLAVGNGVLREKVMAPVLGKSLALPLSGLSLSVIVFLATYLSFGFIQARERSACFSVGAQWVLMTLAFEFLFGHFVVGKSWSALLQNFNITNGDLFLLVLVVTFLSPYGVAKMKGALN